MRKKRQNYRRTRSSPLPRRRTQVSEKGRSPGLWVIEIVAPSHQLVTVAYCDYPPQSQWRVRVGISPNFPFHFFWTTIQKKDLFPPYSLSFFFLRNKITSAIPNRLYHIFLPTSISCENKFNPISNDTFANILFILLEHNQHLCEDRYRYIIERENTVWRDSMHCSSFQIDVGKENRIIRGEVRITDTTKPKPVIIICHGFKGFKDWGFFPTLASHLANNGFAAITFNFSINGIGDQPDVFDELDKFARLTFSREQEDLSILLNHVVNQQLPFAETFNTNRIGLFGHSRGGGNSLIFALDHPEISTVVIWNSIYRVDFFGPEVIDEIKQKGVTMITHARTGQQLPISREVLDDIEQNRARFDILGRLPNLSCRSRGSRSTWTL